MNYMKRIIISIIAIGFLFNVTSCAPSRIERSSEQTHAFCEKYAEEVDWIKYASTGMGFVVPLPLEDIAVNAGKRNIPLCLFEVESAELFEMENGAKRYQLRLLIREVYSGEHPGESVAVSTGLGIAEDSTVLIGQKYLGYLTRDGELSFLYPYWAFFVTEDNFLVSPYGCQLEESQLGDDGLSMESRNYTGQTLDYFISEVREAEAKAQAESQEDRSQ